MTQMIDYTVTLDAFQGPLDLLLFLIRRAEVDVHDIPVAKITEQYMGYLRQLDSIDIETAGEFLVMAATLMEIKSRMLMPKPAVDESSADAPIDAVAAAEDPRADLVRQLLAYKRFRDAASALESRLTQWESRFPTTSAGLPGATPEEIEAAQARDIEDLDLLDLVEAFGKIIETVDLTRVGEHRVTDDETPIEIHAEDILDRLKRDARDLSEQVGGRGMLFRELFAGRTKAEAVGLFLAMLELIRQQRLSTRQDAINGEIFVRLKEEPAVAAPAV